MVALAFFELLVLGSGGATGSGGLVLAILLGWAIAGILYSRNKRKKKYQDGTKGSKPPEYDYFSKDKDKE